MFLGLKSTTWAGQVGCVRDFLRRKLVLGQLAAHEQARDFPLGGRRRHDRHVHTRLSAPAVPAQHIQNRPLRLRVPARHTHWRWSRYTWSRDTWPRQGRWCHDTRGHVRGGGDMIHVARAGEGGDMILQSSLGVHILRPPSCGSSSSAPDGNKMPIWHSSAGDPLAVCPRDVPSGHSSHQWWRGTAGVSMGAWHGAGQG